MEEITRDLTLAEIDQCITRSAVEAVIEIGYYLKQIRDRKLYLEAGCKDVYEYAEKQYGYSQSTTSRNMNRNDKFSVGGNSPELAEEYRLYSKSQLQEMLSLEDKQLKDVKPEMTVKQIREMKPKKKAEAVATSHRSEKCIHRSECFCSLEDDQKLIPGDGVDCNGKCCWNCPKHGKCKLECTSSASRPEPISALGFAKTVRPEGSLINTAGCGDGKYDCFSCHRECDLRQEECYCVYAPLGSPYPCTIIQDGFEQLGDVPEGCQFLNLDFAYHRAGDGESVPCCGKCDYRERCDSVCDKAKESIATSHKDVAEAQHEEPECCDDAAEVYTPRYFLEEQKARLNEILALGEEDIKSLPKKMLERQKIIVAALAAMVCDLEEPERPEQPELPVFKNNDQRKAWLRNYRDWGLWYADSNIGARYYRYEFENGAVLIAEEYENSNKYTGHYVASYLHLIGGPEPTKGTNGIGKWQRHEKYNRFQNNETELVEFLKEVQKK